MEESSSFEYSATLRIFGAIPDLTGLTREMSLQQSNSYRRGERRRPGAEPNQFDMWMFRVPVHQAEPLHVHIDALWAAIRDRKNYLLELKKQGLTVDVFLGYRSNSNTAGVEVPYQSLQMFQELEVPFGLSIIIT